MSEGFSPTKSQEAEHAAGPADFRFRSRAVVRQVSIFRVTCHANRLLTAYSVAGGRYFANLQQIGPGPAALFRQTCDIFRWHLLRWRNERHSILKSDACSSFTTNIFYSKADADFQHIIDQESTPKAEKTTQKTTQKDESSTPKPGKVHPKDSGTCCK